MSAVTITLRADVSEVPAVIAGGVNLLRLSEALARAGLVGRHDPVRGVLVISPAPERCRACGGTGLDEDAQCLVCDGNGMAETPPRAALERPGVGMAVYNSWSRQERAEWHQRAGSAVPAEAWAAWKADRLIR